MHEMFLGVLEKDMITDNNKRTRVYSLVLAMSLLLSSLLVGCNTDKSSSFDAVGEMLETVDTEKVLECEVIYPKGSSAAVVMAARELAELLEAQTEMSVTAHQYDKKYDPEKLYVVIGKVADDVTQYWYDGMREDDYVCRVYKNTVAIGGITDSATLTAIQRFIDEILPASEYGYIAEEGVLFEFIGTYDDDKNQDEMDSVKVLLNGFGLGEYEIVYTDDSLTSLVGELKEGIKQRTSCSLNLSLRNPSKSKREIIVRVNNDIEAMKYRIYGYDGDIFVESASIYGVSFAIDRVLERMSEVTGEETKEIQILEEELFSYINYGITVASYRIEENVRISNKELNSVVSAVKQSGADVITVSVPTGNLWNALNMYLYDTYDHRLLDCNDGSVVAVLSRPNMTVIDEAVLKTEKGTLATEITLTCSNKKYRVLSLYLPEEDCAEKKLELVDALYTTSEEQSICIITTAQNYVMSKDIPNTDSYLCVLEETVNSGTAKYETRVLISPSLDCYNKESIGDDEGRLVGTAVSVRNGIE